MAVERTNGESEGFVDGCGDGNLLGNRSMEGVNSHNIGPEFVDAMPGNVDVGLGDDVVLVDDAVCKEDSRSVDVEDDHTEGKGSH